MHESASRCALDLQRPGGFTSVTMPGSPDNAACAEPRSQSRIPSWLRPYWMLNRDEPYRDLGADWHQRRNNEAHTPSLNSSEWLPSGQRVPPYPR
jgi:hypothetical protein